jgi:hypothetical protein
MIPNTHLDAHLRIQSNLFQQNSLILALNIFFHSKYSSEVLHLRISKACSSCNVETRLQLAAILARFCDAIVVSRAELPQTEFALFDE